MTEPTGVQLPSGIVNRWLSHQVFWPSYVVLILLMLAVLRPWEKWLAGATQRAGVFVNQRFTNPLDDYAVGTVVLAVDSAGAPGEGWIPCDGRRLRCDDHSDLVQRLGTLLPQGEEDFAVPDHRGLAIRSPQEDLGGFTMQLHLDGSPRDPVFHQYPLRFWIKAK